ncbi:MAG: hypothetical protein EHM56_05725 [Chloroflexi bacterium]|nr:MAG: hypothetical protein EHM56_05725 [Chloroflexota bacterium]
MASPTAQSGRRGSVRGIHGYLNSWTGTACKFRAVRVDSTALTSNRALEEWPDLFSNPPIAAAGLERLLHHAEQKRSRPPAPVFRARGATRPAETEVSVGPSP